LLRDESLSVYGEFLKKGVGMVGVFGVLLSFFA